MKNKETKRIDVELQIKAFGDDGTFTGDLSVYDFIDYGGDVTQKGCFTKTLQESGAKVPMLWQHFMDKPIGVMELRDSESSLECKGILNMDMPEAQAAYSMMKFNQKHGIKTGLSMGYFTIKDSVKSGIRYLEEVKLLEGSVVTLAANRLCAVSEVKKAGAEISVERKEFAEELEETQVYDLFSQIVSALYSELWNVVYGSNDEQAAQPAAASAFTAAAAAFSDYLTRLFAIRNADQMEMMAFPDTKFGQKIIAEFETKLQALKAKASATSKEAGAPDAGAANKPNEPGVAHSDVTPEQIKTLVKEIFHG